MSRKRIPFGKGYAAWKTSVDKLMRRGKELYYLGNPKRIAAWK